MPVRFAADLLVFVHFMFILFVIFGGLLGLRWPRVVFVHIPAALWGALIEFAGWICPLTPLEQYLRQSAGDEAYTGGFVEHYLLPLIYPAGLNRGIQVWIGLFVITINVLVYTWLWKRRHQR